jgi:hypothetical protein
MADRAGGGSRQQPAVLAELDVFHSRAFSPTRRVALGRRTLPVEPPPGFGGVLLGGIVAAHMDDLDPELRPDLYRLTMQLEDGRRIPQPRLRHRFQIDHVGLARSRHRLVTDGEGIEFELEERGAPTQQILAAVYAAGQLPPVPRRRVMEAIRKATRWRGPIGPALIAHLSGMGGAQTWSAAAFEDPFQWALGVLGVDVNGSGIDRAEVQRRFRELLRAAHPDHGATSDGAAQRIADLTEARRILLR